MVNLTHGLSIGIERSGCEFFLTLKSIGTITHKEYDVITPMMDSALGEVTHLIVIVLIHRTELDVWDFRALCDELQLCLTTKQEYKQKD